MFKELFIGLGALPMWIYEKGKYKLRRFNSEAWVEDACWLECCKPWEIYCIPEGSSS